MSSDAYISNLTITQIKPSSMSALYNEVGGRYEGNDWLRSDPRFRCNVEFEYEGEMPEEIKLLLKRYQS